MASVREILCAEWTSLCRPARNKIHLLKFAFAPTVLRATPIVFFSTHAHTQFVLTHVCDSNYNCSRDYNEF